MKLYDNIQEALSKKNINIAVGTVYDLMALWMQWYRGKVDDFHTRKIKLATGAETTEEIYTMNMPKKVCEDYARLLWTEKTKIQLASDTATEALWKILDSKENSFSANIPRWIEKSMALGAGCLVEYKDNAGKVIIDYIDGDVILPYKYTNSYISGLIVVSQVVEKEDNAEWYFNRLTYHEYDGQTYTVYNELYKSKDANVLGDEIDFAERYPEVVNPFIVTTDVPYFQVFRPNVANNYNTGSPLGISVYANAIDNFKAIDTKYDSFVREFELGKKRIMIDNTSLKAKANIDEEGNVSFVKYFDENDKAYVAVEGMENQPVKEIDFSLRVEEHVKAINTELSWLSANVGLGNNYYKFDGQSMKTATEVVSENSDTFRSKEAHQIILHDCLYDLVKAVCEMSGLPADDITIIADDSIIEDTNAQRERDRAEVSMGAMSLAEYRAKWYGETLEEAERKLPKEADVVE